MSHFWTWFTWSIHSYFDCFCVRGNLGRYGWYAYRQRKTFAWNECVFRLVLTLKTYIWASSTFEIRNKNMLLHCHLSRPCNKVRFWPIISAFSNAANGHFSPISINRNVDDVCKRLFHVSYLWRNVSNAWIFISSNRITTVFSRNIWIFESSTIRSNCSINCWSTSIHVCSTKMVYKKNAFGCIDRNCAQNKIIQETFMRSNWKSAYNALIYQ